MHKVKAATATLQSVINNFVSCTAVNTRGVNNKYLK